MLAKSDRKRDRYDLDSLFRRTNEEMVPREGTTPRSALSTYPNRYSIS